MVSARQFTLLLWKNYLLQKRQFVITLLQMILPALFASLLIALRVFPRPADVLTPTKWNSFNIPSVTSPDQGCLLYYSPNTSSVTRTIMEGVLQRIESINETIGFDSETSLVRHFLEKLEAKQGLFNQSGAQSFINSKSCDVLAAVVFLELPSADLDDSESYSIGYKLRFPSTLRTSVPDPAMRSIRWNTELVFPDSGVDTGTIGPRNNRDYGGPPDYVAESFLTLQYSVDMAIIEAIKNDSYGPDELIDLQMERFPYPPYKTDSFITIIQTLFPLLVMLGFYLCSMLMVRDIVYEKEQRLKESMQMMGLDRRLHWLAWLFRYLFLLAASITIETGLLVGDIGAGGPVLRCISPLLLFAFLMSYVVATIAFCLAVSALFSRANLATAVGSLLFFISYIPYLFLQPHYDSTGCLLKVIACFLSNVAMAFGAHVIGEHESSVFPGEYGIPKPWNFPFQLKNHSTAISPMELGRLQNSDGLLSDEDSEADEFVPLVNLFSSDDGLDKDNFEPDPIGLAPGIMMHNLNKEFCRGSSRTKAVSGLTLNVYEGQTTVLLGHNGAGKTTTFSILTGLYSPSSGKALVNGFDIAKDMDLVRRSLGICPQNSILFESLTVEEHLVFFSKLKAASVLQTKDEVLQMMSDVGLLSKRLAPVSTLSGGMRRKLSVGIAFIGGSKVVILDEPTSGMDPYSQRQTWNLIRRCLTGRTVLLSTHSMDEAEALGDRIAIMVNGVIKCCGSPMFLKNKYGSGYRLTVDKSADCDVSRLTDFVESYVPEARLRSSHGAEVSYLLPHSSRGKFAQLFDGIDCKREQLKIAVYGISMATLEEVFLRVGSSLWSYDTGGNSLMVNKELTDDDDERFQTSDQLLWKHFEPLVSCCHVWRRRLHACLRHFCALLKKKALHTMRNRQVTFAQFLVPLVFVTLPLFFRRRLFPVQDSPPLVMDLSMFSDPVVVFGFGIAASSGRDLADFASNYSSGFNTDVMLVNVNNSIPGAKHCGTMRKYLVGEGNKSLVNYVNRFEIAICLSSSMSENLSIIEAIAFFNNEAYHTPAISLNAFDNALLRYTMAGSRWKIETINHPLPRTSEEILKDQTTQSSDGYAIVFITVLGMSFLAASFALFLIRERSVGAKRCQMTSGATARSFWASTLLCDWIVFALLCVVVLASFAVFHIKPFAIDGNWMYVALLFALYGWAVLPFVYLASFSFAVPSSGFIWLTAVNILLVSLTMIVEFLDAMVPPDLMYIVKTFELISQLVPNYGLAKGLSTLYANNNLLVICKRDDIAFSCSMQGSHPCCKATCGEHCFVYSENPLGMDSRSGIGQVLLFLAFDGLLYFAILLLIDSGRLRIFYYHIQDALNWLKRCFMNSWSDEDDLPEDGDDVATERRRINETPHKQLIVSEIVLLKELTKRFGRVVAVDRLSVGIREGECFGLLGANGAGKTTVFEMIVGDKFISQGLAFLFGQDIKRIIGKVGYSPQSDALIDELTGRELLSLYACLRGVNSKSIRLSVQDLIDALLLRSDADQLINTYSGGTRQKLSTAVALIGSPRLILLDEPSSGLDPVARRHLWNTLLKLRDSKRTIVLSTHSMEECETLCTRLAIMVNGRFQCLSSTQHLKNTFGTGFSLSIKFHAGTEANISDEAVEEVKTLLRASFPGSSFKNVENSILLCCVADESVQLSQIFLTMETLQSRLPTIEDYSVTQATLEEIFVSFARAQLPTRPAISWAKNLKRIICRFVCSCCRLCWSTYSKKRSSRSSSL